MALTSQRIEELRAEYEALKQTIREINHKYSLDAYEVDLGFPPTLGLEKLTFTPKTDKEIAALAAQQVEEKCAPKVAAAEKSLMSQNATLQERQTSAEEANKQKLAKIQSDYDAETETARHRAVNANLQYSTLFEQALSDIRDAYDEAILLQQSYYATQTEAFRKRADANMQIYQQQIARIDELRNTLTEKISAAIREKDEKQAVAVKKYNNTVDEKENKYQFSCKRATQLAIQAEQNRALAAARMYASLGEVGYERLKKTEKYYACINKFGDFTKEEAKFILSLDNFLQAELQDFYSTLVDWVNNYMN